VISVTGHTLDFELLVNNQRWIFSIMTQCHTILRKSLWWFDAQETFMSNHFQLNEINLHFRVRLDKTIDGDRTDTSLL